MEKLIACHGCDLLVDLQGLEGEVRANCPRCGHFLTRFRRDPNGRILACSIAAMITLALACSFPFLSFAAAGLESVMTLPQTPGALWENGMPEIAVLVAGFIIVIPAVVLVLLLLLCMPLYRGQWRPWLVPVARWAFNIQGWAMVEVFIIGVIVSLVKIAKMATVELGISFWAYVAFSVLFTMAVAALDRYQCWEQIEALQPDAHA